MSRTSALSCPDHAGHGLARLFQALRGHKPVLSVCTDRMAALDDPRTRRALAYLPPHILQDIGVTDNRDAATTPLPEGEALRRHFW